MGGGKGGGAAAQARADEQARQEKVRQGTERIGSIFDGQFNDQFYTDRQKAYQDYAQPQLQDQFQKAQQELTYSLARGGNLNSSTRGDQTAKLQQQYDLMNQKVADDALAQANQSRSQVEGARSDLVSMLNATGDAEGAANSATSRASMLTQPQQYSPLTGLFSDFTSGLGTQAALERASAMSGQQFGRYNTGLFGGGTSRSVSVRN